MQPLETDMAWGQNMSPQNCRLDSSQEWRREDGGGKELWAKWAEQVGCPAAGGHRCWKVVPKTTACLDFLSTHGLLVHRAEGGILGSLLVEDFKTDQVKNSGATEEKEMDWHFEWPDTKVWSSFWVKNNHKSSASNTVYPWEGYMAQIHVSFLSCLHATVIRSVVWIMNEASGFSCEWFSNFSIQESLTVEERKLGSWELWGLWL